MPRGRFPFLITLIGLLMTLLFSGCANITPSTVSFDTRSRYGQIGLIVNDGLIDEHMEPAGYINIRIVDQTSFVFRDELQKTGVFERVELNNPYREVLLNVRFQRKDVDDNLAKALFQGATVFLVPTTNKFVNTMKVEVRVRAETVKTYEFVVDSTQRIFLTDDPYKERRGVAASLWSRFLAAAQKDRLFEEIVPSALKRQRSEAAPSSAVPQSGSAPENQPAAPAPSSS